jgi:hypothetical protein
VPELLADFSPSFSVDKQRPDLSPPKFTLELNVSAKLSPGYIFVSPYDTQNPGPYIYDNEGVRFGPFHSGHAGELLLTCDGTPGRTWYGAAGGPLDREMRMGYTSVNTTGPATSVFSRGISRRATAGDTG